MNPELFGLCYQLPKLNVAGSSPVSRSKFKARMGTGFPVFMRVFLCLKHEIRCSSFFLNMQNH